MNTMNITRDSSGKIELLVLLGKKPWYAWGNGWSLLKNGYFFNAKRRMWMLKGAGKRRT